MYKHMRFAKVRSHQTYLTAVSEISWKKWEKKIAIMHLDFSKTQYVLSRLFSCRRSSVVLWQKKGLMSGCDSGFLNTLCSSHVTDFK